MLNILIKSLFIPYIGTQFGRKFYTYLDFESRSKKLIIRVASVDVINFVSLSSSMKLNLEIVRIKKSVKFSNYFYNRRRQISVYKMLKGKSRIRHYGID